MFDDRDYGGDDRVVGSLSLEASDCMMIDFQTIESISFFLFLGVPACTGLFIVIAIIIESSHPSHCPNAQRTLGTQLTHPQRHPYSIAVEIPGLSLPFRFFLKTNSTVAKRTGMDSVLPTDSLLPQSKCIKVVDENGILR